MSNTIEDLGFGLGGSICIDENVGLSNSNAGDFGWGGLLRLHFILVINTIILLFF